MNIDNYKAPHLVICTDPTGTETVVHRTYSLTEANRIKCNLADKYPICDYDIIASPEVI